MNVWINNTPLQFSSRVHLRIFAVLAVGLGWSTSDVLAQSGPAGVGAPTTNALWLIATDNVYTDGGITPGGNNSAIQQWNDASGNNDHAVQTTGSQKPVLVVNQANGFDALRFDGTNSRILAAGVGTANVATIFVVVRFNNLINNNDGIIHAGPSGTAFSGTTTDKVIGMWINTTNGRIWGRGVQSNNATRDISQVTTLSTGQFYIITQQYDGASIMQYVNGVLSGSVTYDGTLKSWSDFGIGRQASESLNGDIAEIIVHRSSLNVAQRIITENYLAAKYGLTLGQYDLYNKDNAGNGNYDYEVAGIGRFDASNIHPDAKGTGMVRILSPSNLGDGEFLLWGHDNAPAIANNNTDVPASVDARLNRVWRVSEVNTGGGGTNVGSVSIQWDLTGLGSVTAAHLALLVDTDNDGSFADETPITGATSLGSDIFQFANVAALTNNRRFTLGTTNFGQTALPIVLRDFQAQRIAGDAVICWQTLTEKNTSFFQVERSADGLRWTKIKCLEAKGQSISPQQYKTTDPSPPPGDLYYRLRLVNTNGSSQLFPVVFVNGMQRAAIAVFPVPVRDVVTVHKPRTAGNFSVFDAEGRDVTGLVKLIHGGTTVLKIDMRHLSDGVYLLQIGADVVRLIKSSL